MSEKPEYCPNCGDNARCGHEWHNGDCAECAAKDADIVRLTAEAENLRSLLALRQSMPRGATRESTDSSGMVLSNG